MTAPDSARPSRPARPAGSSPPSSRAAAPRTSASNSNRDRAESAAKLLWPSVVATAVVCSLLGLVWLILTPEGGRRLTAVPWLAAGLLAAAGAVFINVLEKRRRQSRRP